MRLNRGLWAGASLLLALVGCSKDSDTIEGTGVYSPILTGISSNFEPAVRGVPNQLSAQVTNVNALALRYHWSASAGTITDTTSAVATWTPPDSIGTYDVTVSIEADDNGTHFFRTMTVHMAVDNEFARWTRSETVKFDAAPTSGGGALYAEFRNTAIGSSDAYRVDAPLGPPLRLTTNFFSVSSPTPRADQTQFAFAGRKRSSDAGPSIWLLPWGGGDSAAAQVLAARSTFQTQLAAPRFARQGSRIVYTTDSTTAQLSGFLNIHTRNAADLNAGPVPVLDTLAYLNIFSGLIGASWGPDINSDGNADSLIVPAYDFFGTTAQSLRGFFKIATPDSGKVTEAVLWLSDPAMVNPDWSPDGTLVAFSRRNHSVPIDSDIWVISSAATSLSQAVRVTSGPANDTQPRFSADGNTIFFISNRSDRYGLNGVFGTERRGTNVWSVTRFDRP